MNDDVVVRDFRPGDEAAFRRLNEEWISRYFVLETKDLQAFDDPQSSILVPGGRIFMACLRSEAVGCCALLLMTPGVYEIGKMAVTASAQGHGIGRRVLEHAIAEARSLGATRLYLETNHALTPAIALYERVGFRHMPPEEVTPSPYARADTYMDMLLA